MSYAGNCTRLYEDYFSDTVGGCCISVQLCACMCVHVCIVDIVWVMGEADELADCIYGEHAKLLNHFVNEVCSLISL